MQADLYDFDKTIFQGESGSEFWRFCIKRHPLLLRYAPKQIYWFVKKFVFHTATMEQFKDNLYSFLKAVDAEKMSELFWQENEHRINQWFKSRDKDVATIVCSASPIFQIKPICDRLGVDLLIATQMDSKTGKMIGNNCRSSEKVNRIKKEASQYVIRDVYTDDIEHDAPMLELATRNKYKVDNGNLYKI